jgi:hypothetical protein
VVLHVRTRLSRAEKDAPQIVQVLMGTAEILAATHGRQQAGGWSPSLWTTVLDYALETGHSRRTKK